jgi:hypothetical protein
VSFAREAAKLLTKDEARRISGQLCEAAGAFAQAAIRSVELIVQPDAHDVEAIVKDGVER